MLLSWDVITSPYTPVFRWISPRVSPQRLWGAPRGLCLPWRPLAMGMQQVREPGGAGLHRLA